MRFRRAKTFVPYSALWCKSGLSDKSSRFESRSTGVPAGIGRVWALCDSFLLYVERSIFPGGCFFEAAAAEFDSRPGRVRDSVIENRRYLVESLARAIRRAQVVGDVEQSVDADQVAWELNCLLIGANGTYVIDGGKFVFQRARSAIRDRLQRAASRPPAELPAL